MLRFDNVAESSQSSKILTYLKVTRRIQPRRESYICPTSFRCASCLVCHLDVAWSECKRALGAQLAMRARTKPQSKAPNDAAPRTDCIPIFTINSGIALRYGIDKCVAVVVKVINEFAARGTPLPATHL